MRHELGRIVEGVRPVVIIRVSTSRLCKRIAWLLWPLVLVSLDSSLQLGVNCLVLRLGSGSSLRALVDLI